MAYTRPHANGYANGTDSTQLRRFDLDVSSRETSADERSRSRGPGGSGPSQGPTDRGRGGGYGGYGRQPVAEHVRAPARLDRGFAQRRSRDYTGWDSSRSRSRPGTRYGAAGSQVEGKFAPGAKPQ